VRRPLFGRLAFELGLLLAFALTAVLALRAARQEWFSQDDFIFLEQVLVRDPWSWVDVWLPLRERFWMFYRPLSMETYFYVGQRLFGLDAFGYFAFSLALHLATAPLVCALARELGFARPVAMATALLAVSRPASLTEIFYGSCFMYVAVTFALLVCALCFLRRLRGGGAGWQAASCVALLAAFASNEVAIAAPALLALLAFGARSEPLSRAWAARVARALAPALALTAGFLVFRFALIAPIDNVFWNEFVRTSIYRHTLGPHVLPNAARLLYEVFGDPWVLAGALAALAAAAAGLALAPPARRAWPWLGRQHVVLLGWLAAVLPAFALLPQHHERWSMLLGVPAALLFGAWCEAAWRAFGARHPGAFEAALLLLVFAGIPYAALAARAADPKGGPPRRLAAWIGEQALPPRATLVMLYGAPGLADPEEAQRLDRETHYGRLLDVVEREAQRTLRFHDLSRRPPRNVLRPDSVYVALLPGIRFERLDPAGVERLLPRGVSARP
jgi:hypothetical protein